MAQVMNRRRVLRGLAGAGVAAIGAPLLGGLLDTESGRLADILPGLNPESRAKLHSLLSAPGSSGQIPADVVRELVLLEKKPVPQLMLALLPLARSYSHPPISNYRVGVVARGASGSLYPGFNIEIPGEALGFAVHGEQAALSSAYMHGEAGVEAIALTAAPCGHCRQFMNELSPEGEIEILVEGAAPMRLSALLPMAFGPKDLGRKQGAFPVVRVELTSSAAADAVVEAAFEAARSSYAPYSGANSGVAVSTRAGRIYKGSYIENVAFNPSLPPLQTALVEMLVVGEEYAAISRVVLVERSGAKISQKLATAAVLSAVAPSVRLETVMA